MNVKRGLRSVAAVIIGLVTVGAVATPSFAATAPLEYVKNGKGSTAAQPLYLTASGTAGSLVTVKTNLGGSALQRWYMEYDGSYYIIRSDYTSGGYALSIQNNDSTNGTKVLTWYYQPTNNFEKWKLEWVNNKPRYRNVGTQKCLGVTGGTASSVPSGSQVIIWDCGSGPDQQWSDVWL